MWNPHLANDVTPADVTVLADRYRVPVLVKGVLRADDARRAVDAGAAGVIVSNHGARNLDTAPATADVLAAVVDELRGAVPVLVDGGVRRGTDVAAALCLGADAVLVGRPVIWGLTTYGAAGVQHVLEILRAELEMAMALLGAPTRRRAAPATSCSTLTCPRAPPRIDYRSGVGGGDREQLDPGLRAPRDRSGFLAERTDGGLQVRHPRAAGRRVTRQRSGVPLGRAAR